MKICGNEIKVQGRLIRVARLELDAYEFLDDPEPTLDGLRRAGIRIDLFTFMQRLPETSPKYAYPMEWDNLAALPVSTFDAWWTKQVDGKTRNMIRRAEKMGVNVKEVPFDDALVQGIWEIYNECPVRQGKPFVHYGKSIETVRKEAGRFLGNSLFIGAFLGDKLVGFGKLTWDRTRTQASLMSIVSMVSHRDKAPTNALIAQAVRSCADHGISYLVYSHFSFGRKQRDSLSDFKERNGFRRIDLPRYYVPLTHIGSLTLRLGLHKRFIDHVPEPVLAKVRELRNAWYNRKFQSIAKSS